MNEQCADSVERILNARMALDVPTDCDSYKSGFLEGFRFAIVVPEEFREAMMVSAFEMKQAMGGK